MEAAVSKSSWPLAAASTASLRMALKRWLIVAG
jgi:hypothetical protein